MRDKTAQNDRYVGRSVRRVNDGRLLTGQGRFVDDIRLPDTLHAVIVRSPHPHAEIRGIDASAAKKVPGVHAVYTGDELACWVEPQVTSAELLPSRELRRYPLAVGQVRCIGDPVAVVVADDPVVAQDAAELVDVDYEPLAAVVDAAAALRERAPLLYPEWESNLALRWQVDSGDVDATFAEAERTVEVRLVNQRVYAAFLETRGALARWDAATGELMVWASTQGPHSLRTAIAAAVGVPEHRVRVIAPDVGGAFGSKGGIYPEYVLVAALSLQLGRPVKWIESRSESFLATSHGRDQIQRLRAAVDRDGTIRALDIEITANFGAYNAAATVLRTGLMSAGPYRVRNLRTTVHGVMTNTTPIGAYRGAGRPEAAYMLERLVDAVAHELGLDPADVRRRNFIPSDEFPYTSPTGAVYDSGNYTGALDEALRRIDYEQARDKQVEARRGGRLVGIGIAAYCEYAGPGWDSASVRVQPSGTVTVSTGTSPHGQGQETSLAQVVADELGVDLGAVVVHASDTAITPQGVGTFGSRGTAIGGSAILLAAREVHEKACRVAAQMLEAAVEDVVADGGQFHVVGVPGQGVTFQAVARQAYNFGGLVDGLEPGLDATRYFMPEGRTVPFGVHVAMVEIDPDTGELTVLRYLAVDDCGPLINPQLVEGQVHGGVAQGFGQALREGIVYDESGELLTGSLLDYAMFRASGLPNFESAHTFTPSPFNPLGVKGIGEAGTTGAPPALVNAALDALAPLGVTHLDMPLTPERVWRAIQSARS